MSDPLSTPRRLLRMFDFAASCIHNEVHLRLPWAAPSWRFQLLCQRMEPHDTMPQRRYGLLYTFLLFHKHLFNFCMTQRCGSTAERVPLSAGGGTRGRSAGAVQAHHASSAASR